MAISPITLPECVCNQSSPHHAACPIAAVERETAARFGSASDGIHECGLLVPYVAGTKSLDSLDKLTDSQTRAIKAARAWVVRAGPAWLFLASHETGLAKTHIASSALALAIRAGYSGRYVKLARMMLELIDAPLGSKVKTLERFTRPRCLVIDEIGAEKASEYTISSLSQVVDDRYDCVRPTILVSNLHLDEIGSKYSPANDTIAARRIVDRIYEMTGGKSGEGRFLLDGKSWRKQ